MPLSLTRTEVETQLTKGILLAMPDDLPIIQKTYDLIKWYVPILHRLPRDYRFTLGDRMILPGA